MPLEDGSARGVQYMGGSRHPQLCYMMLKPCTLHSKNLVAAFYKEIPTDLAPPRLEREGVRNLSIMANPLSWQKQRCCSPAVPAGPCRIP